MILTKEQLGASIDKRMSLDEGDHEEFGRVNRIGFAWIRFKLKDEILFLNYEKIRKNEE